MGKFIWYYSKTEIDHTTSERLENIVKHLANEADTVPKSLSKHSKNNFLGITNKFDHWRIIDFSICAGVLISGNDSWSDSYSNNIDGYFAIVREDIKTIEALTDVISSKALWYVLTEDYIAISNSQRALIMIIDDFKINPSVIPWILSSGSLGPIDSWHVDIEKIPANSTLFIDKASFKVKIIRREIKNSSKCINFNTKKNIEARLVSLLDHVHKAINVNMEKWLLPLSGGYDSRAIAIFLIRNHDIRNLKSVTWGKSSSIEISFSDAAVAKQLAKDLKIEHEYYVTELNDKVLNAEIIVNRFVRFGEGRIDHISGYLDGFEMWKSFFKEGKEGIFRGDQIFKITNVRNQRSSYTTRMTMGLCLCADFVNLEKYAHKYFQNQTLPDYLKRKEKESFTTYARGVYLNFRLPIILAALNDLKLPFVDVIPSLINEDIIKFISKLDDNDKKYGFYYMNVIESMVDGTPFAKAPAIEEKNDVLSHPSFIKLYSFALQSPFVNDVLPHDLIEYVNSGILDNQNRVKKLKSPTLISKIKYRLVNKFPNAYKYYYRLINKKKTIDINVLGFRILMIYTFYNIVNDDLDSIRKKLQT